jgi:hypothetical protein
VHLDGAHEHEPTNAGVRRLPCERQCSRDIGRSEFGERVRRHIPHHVHSRGEMNHYVYIGQRSTEIGIRAQLSDLDWLDALRRSVQRAA